MSLKFFLHAGCKYAFPYEIPAGEDPYDWLLARRIADGLRGGAIKPTKLLMQWLLLESVGNLRVRDLLRSSVQVTGHLHSGPQGESVVQFAIPLELDTVVQQIKPEYLRNLAPTYFQTQSTLAKIRPLPPTLSDILNRKYCPSWIRITPYDIRDESFYSKLDVCSSSSEIYFYEKDMVKYFSNYLIVSGYPLTEHTQREILEQISRKKSPIRRPAVTVSPGLITKPTKPHVLFGNAYYRSEARR